jgi:D-3-phosphoglycerate dehydrogenase
MRVIFYDIVTKLPIGNAHQVSTLDEVLTTADIITLHVPETPATKNMIGKEQFEKMKSNCVFINASRGTVVDIDALTETLSEKKLLGAAIDVYPHEPKGDNDIFKSPLQEFDNVILTPHIGGSTLEAQANIGQEVAEKLIKYSDNGSTITAVNFPEVSLPEHPEYHRLLHIHKNVPGVLANINRVFQENNINIASQYLQTKETVGYVVMDVESEYSELALSKLKEVPGTIRTRIIF